jgi:hypothetical protein
LARRLVSRDRQPTSATRRRKSPPEVREACAGVPTSTRVDGDASVSRLVDLGG